MNNKKFQNGFSFTEYFCSGWLSLEECLWGKTGQTSSLGISVSWRNPQIRQTTIMMSVHCYDFDEFFAPRNIMSCWCVWILNMADTWRRSNHCAECMRTVWLLISFRMSVFTWYLNHMNYCWEFHKFTKTCTIQHSQHISMNMKRIINQQQVSFFTNFYLFSMDVDVGSIANDNVQVWISLLANVIE